MKKFLSKINLIRLLNLQRLERQVIFFLVLLVFVIVTYLVATISLKLDLSNGRAYTLSPATKKILKKLDDLVTIKFFVSSDLPSRFLPVKTDILDLLAEYKKEGGGKIKTVVKDPKKDSDALRETQEVGLPQLQFSQLEQNKYAISSSYFGVVLAYSNKKELIPYVADLNNLEYNLDSAIYQMTSNSRPKIGIMGTPAMAAVDQDGLVTLKKILDQQFETVTLVDEIDSSIKSLLIFPKDYTQEEIEKLNSFFTNSGSAIIFTEGVSVTDSLTAAPSKNSLSSLAEKYGIKVNTDLALSASSELVNFGSGLVNILAPYPFWVKTNKFNNRTSYFANIQQLTFPWVSTLSLEKKNGFENYELVKTMDRSWIQRDSFSLNPQTIPQPQEKELKNYTIVAQSKNKKGGSLIVIPSSRFIVDNYLNQNSDNLEFVLNILNELASGGVLSGIRQRAVAFYPVPDLPEKQKDLFKYMNIFFLPVLFGIYGALRLARRK